MIKKVTLKRNLLPVVMFTVASICSHNNVFSNNAPQEIKVQAQNITLTKEDIASFELIADNIKQLIVDTQQTLEKFIDEKDKTPYASYISKFDQQMNLLEATIITPLKQKIVAAQAHTQLPSEYKQALKVTEEILTKVKSQIAGIITILKDKKYNSANKKAGVELATAFQKYIEKLSKDYHGLDNQLDELHNYLLKLELASLAGTITFVRQKLKQAKANQEEPVSNTRAMKIARVLKQKIDRK